MNDSYVQIKIRYILYFLGEKCYRILIYYAGNCLFCVYTVFKIFSRHFYKLSCFYVYSSINLDTHLKLLSYSYLMTQKSFVIIESLVIRSQNSDDVFI